MSGEINIADCKLKKFVFRKLNIYKYFYFLLFQSLIC